MTYSKDKKENYGISTTYCYTWVCTKQYDLNDCVVNASNEKRFEKNSKGDKKGNNIVSLSEKYPGVQDIFCCWFCFVLFRDKETVEWWPESHGGSGTEVKIHCWPGLFHWTNTASQKRQFFPGRTKTDRALRYIRGIFK